MAFLVKQEHHAVFSESHNSAWGAVTGKLEIEAAKKHARERLERARG